MRNAGITFLLSLLLGLIALSACSNDDDVVVEGDDVVYTGLLTADSISFRNAHHYWKGYRLLTTDTLEIVTSVPQEGWDPDTLTVARHDDIVVADIALRPTSGPDSVWLKVVTVDDTIPVQGWVSESELLQSSRPTHFVASMLSIFGSLADIPDGRYPDAWLEFYFHPTANPWMLPWPMAIVVLLLWIALIVFIAFLDRLIFDRHRYRCGSCGAPIKSLGRCPHCGVINHFIAPQSCSRKLQN